MVSIKLPVLSEADKIEEHLNAIDSWFDLQAAGTADTDAKKRNFLKFSIANVKSVYTIFSTEIANTDTYAEIKNKLKKIYSSSSSELNFIMVSSNNVERERNRVENKEKE